MLTKNKIIGTMLPISSLYSIKNQNYVNGIIDDGLLFIDWLKITNQHAWQILPIHETEYLKDSRINNTSPYKGFGIGINPKYASKKYKLPSDKELDKFRKENDFWLSDYSLFCALRDHFQTDDWTSWPDDFKDYKKLNINVWRNKLKKEILQYDLIQWQLHSEYKTLKDKARKNNISLIGDMQFYLPLKSPLVWKYKHLFLLDENTLPDFVSGVPYKKGVMYGRQVWGHPLYDWQDDSHNSEIISIFIKRLKYLSNLYDLIRLDHTSGFFRYGKINIHNKNNDAMSTGPGNKALEEIINSIENSDIQIFAEDAGYDIGTLPDALKKLEIPGVRVIRCAYDEVNKQFNNIHADITNFPQNSVTYTTTHDTETLVGFLEQCNSSERKILAKKLGIEYTEDLKKFTTEMINLAINCPSQFVIIPFQDWFFLKDRINIPGTEEINNRENWKYRISSPIEDLINRPALAEFQTILSKQANTSG